MKRSRFSALPEIVKRVRDEGAFERLEMHFKEDNYIVATHNLRNPEKSCWSNIKGARPASESALKNRGNYKVLCDSSLPIVCHGLLPGEKEITEQEPVYGWVPKKGISGWFGSKTREQVGERDVPKTVYEGPQPLSRIVETDSSESAFFLQVLNRSIYPDASGRIGSATRTVVTGEKLMKEVVQYLRENPGSVYNFLHGVQTGEIDIKPFVGDGKLALLDLDKIRDIRRKNPKFKDSPVITDYGFLELFSEGIETV